MSLATVFRKDLKYKNLGNADLFFKMDKALLVALLLFCNWSGGQEGNWIYLLLSVKSPTPECNGKSCLLKVWGCRLGLEKGRKPEGKAIVIEREKLGMRDWIL